MVGFVLFGFKGEDGFEFRGRSAVVEESVHSSLPFKRQESEVKRVNVKKKGVLE